MLPHHFFELAEMMRPRLRHGATKRQRGADGIPAQASLFGLGKPLVGSPALLQFRHSDVSAVVAPHVPLPAVEVGEGLGKDPAAVADRQKQDADFLLGRAMAWQAYSRCDRASMPS